MPEQTPDASKLDAQPPPEAAPPADPRAELSKLPKAELIDRLTYAEAERLRMERLALEREPPHRRARPEDAMVIQALIDLHRTVEERQGATIRGRSPSIGNRYLEAAKALGDELVLAVLGPATKA